MTADAPAADGGRLLRFLFDRQPVRGAVVRLDAAWRELLARRDAAPHPAPVRALLGEMVAAGLLMQSGLRFDGALVLQAQGDGPVKLAVAEVQGDLAFRATATLVGDVAADAGLEAMLNANGRGRCAITLDPRQRRADQPPYQGVVPLHGDRREPLQRIEQVLEHYMLQSEQLPTRLVLAADDAVAAGLLLQRVPLEGERNLGGSTADDSAADDAFERTALLAATLTREELLTLAPEQILHRLFWDDALRVFDAATPRFACRCSRDRVRNMLRGLGRAESDSLIAERGEVEVACEFCGRQYRFDAVDVGELFTPAREKPPADPTERH